MGTSSTRSARATRIRRVPRISYLAFAALGLVVLASCTLTHPLDGYSDQYGASDGGVAGDASPALDGGGGLVDAAMQVDAGDIVDSGDGCLGVPSFLEPADNATVGASMRVRITAPSCIATMWVYVDSVKVLHVTGSSADQSIPIAIGTHKVNVNGWANTDAAHSSQIITVTRTK